MGTRNSGFDRTFMETPARTPLYPLHARLGAKFVAFAGYEMPVQFPAGILSEHLHTRDKAGLFDVSHMGQIRLSGPEVVATLETLVPGDIAGLPQGRVRYTQFTDPQGGILDDLMVTNRGDHLHLVVNAATKAADLAHLRARLGPGVAITPLKRAALLALQGPLAAAVMTEFDPQLASLPFMAATETVLADIPCFVTRCGYTGEDGFEISLAETAAVAFAEALLSDPRVAPIGLGARDSLRLEAGLCLYGHDIDTTTTPVEADLLWSIGKRRRQEGGFLGATTILAQIASGPARRRVGILPEGRAPAREHTEITHDDRTIGRVTSGGFGPSLGGPIAMGYVEAGFASPGTVVQLMVRGTPRPARVAALPFIPNRHFRPPSPTAGA